MSVELQNITNRLRSLASEMIDLGFEMNSRGGFSDVAVRGVELAYVGTVVNSWVDDLESPNKRCCPKKPETLTYQGELT